MTVYEKFIKNIQLRRFIVLFIVIFVLWLARSLMNTILLTFIFTYLVTRLVHLIQRHVHVPSLVILVPLYGLIIWLLYFAVTRYIPQIGRETINLGQRIIDFYNNPKNASNDIIRVSKQIVEKMNILDQVKSSLSVVFSYVTGIGSLGVTFFLSFILSFFYAIEERQMHSFSRSFLTSTFDWFFQDIHYFAEKFANTFGVVLSAQFFIALVNTTLTTIVLIFMGMPQIPSLAIMVFILSLIPVAGVVISLIPLSVIGYSVGGINDIIYLIITILVIHMLEAYVLNPKFISSRTDLPIFYTFVVLLVGERLFGTWGLIVGIPIFTFLLDILGIKAIKIQGKPKLRFDHASKQTDQVKEASPDEKNDETHA